MEIGNLPVWLSRQTGHVLPEVILLFKLDVVNINKLKNKNNLYCCAYNLSNKKQTTKADIKDF